VTKAENLPYTTHGPFATHSPEWHAHRAKCIGASEIASILRVPGAFSTPLKVWADKKALLQSDPPTEAPDFLRFGLKLEPVIADEFAERTGLLVEEEDRQFISKPYPFLGCSLDRWFYKGKAKGPLDLKNTGFYMKDRWEDGIYLPYQVQVQGQMAVTGAEIGACAVLMGGNEFKWGLVERNQRFIDAMLEKLERFWEMVINDIMPEPEAEDTKLVGVLLGRESAGVSVALTGDWVDVDEQLQKTKEEIKKLTETKDKLEARLKMKIGEAERGVLPGGGQYIYKTVERQGYTVQATSVRQLRRIK